MLQKLLAPILLIVLYTNTSAQPGTLDTTFGDGGFVVPPAAFLSNAMAIRPNGKIVHAGASSETSGHLIAVSQYNSDGSLDTSFGTNGVAENGVNNFYQKEVTAVAIQPDGKIVVAAIYDNKFIFTRFNANGTHDSTLNPVYNSQMDMRTMKIFFGDDGSFTFAGVVIINSECWPVVLRFSATGTDISTFAPPGGYTIGWLTDTVMQADGKVIFGGFETDTSTNPFQIFSYLLRFNPDGTLDNTFNGAGEVQFRYANSTTLTYCLALQPDGKLVAGGISTEFNHITRFNTDGTPDQSFGTGGMANMGLLLYPHTMGVEPGGSITLGGTFGNMTGFSAARVTASGVLDTNYVTGMYIPPIPFIAGTKVFGTIQPDGKLIMATRYIQNEVRNVISARFNTGNTAGVNEIKHARITAYPNPVSDILYIDNPENAPMESIAIVDITGKIVMEQNNSSQISMAQLSAGLYFLQIKSGNNSYHHKFIKQ